MSASKLPAMTADEFLAWAMEQPEGAHHELQDGAVVSMAPERSIHALTKLRIAFLLSQSIAAAGLECTVYPDGMAVRIDASTVLQPDAMLRCGPPLPDDAVVVTDPMVVVEVLSPSSGTQDRHDKLLAYFSLPAIRHYLIVDAQRRVAIHHARDEAGIIITRIIHDSAVTLDPPGIVIADLFG